MKRLPSVLLVLVIFLFALNVAGLKYLARLEARIEKLETQALTNAPRLPPPSP